ncbi:MAG: hypothetical protein DDT26_02420 [Dehalococcoidia bacterium]|nr:hypothetical protein [Chloroflexota bacterium]
MQAALSAGSAKLNRTNRYVQCVAYAGVSCEFTGYTFLPGLFGCLELGSDDARSSRQLRKHSGWRSRCPFKIVILSKASAGTNSSR